MKDKIIVSTDIGSDPDDALAIFAMINAGLDVRAIYTTNAKKLDYRSYIAKHLVNLLGKEIVVGQGKANALENFIDPFTHFEEYFIHESFEDNEASLGMKDIEFKKLEDVGIIRNGIEDLAERLEEEHVIFSLAPLTNIAHIIQYYPSQAKNIKRCYILGGSLQGNEHNFRFDPLAADVVLKSAVPFTLIPKETCDRYRMPKKFLDNLSSDSGKYVKHMALGYLASHLSLEILIELVFGYVELEFNNTSWPKSTDKDKKRIDEEFRSRFELLLNMDDPVYGCFYPDNYFKQFANLITHLQNPELNYPNGNILAIALELSVQNNMSVSDVYVPYCYMYPQRLATIKGPLDINDSLHLLNENQEIVMNIDYKDFEIFLQENLQ